MKTPQWSNRTYFAHGGEASPFFFHGKEFYLLNISAWHQDAPAGTPDHAVVVDAATHERGAARVLEGHYFISAFECAGRVYCLGIDLRAARENWTSSKISLSWSDDLVHWSAPRTVVEHPQGAVFNTATIHDGRRFVLLLEVRDPGRPFEFIFFESQDLVHWRQLPGASLGTQMRYIGAPAMYYFPDQEKTYVTYLHEFDNPATPGLLNYDTRLARTADYIHWEFAAQPVISPDYGHRLTLVGHPEVFEVNVGDAEFIEAGGKVKIYACGGNQLGVHDYFVAECGGTLEELFTGMFDS